MFSILLLGEQAPRTPLKFETPVSQRSGLLQIANTTDSHEHLAGLTRLPWSVKIVHRASSLAPIEVMATISKILALATRPPYV